MIEGGIRFINFVDLGYQSDHESSGNGGKWGEVSPLLDHSGDVNPNKK